MTDYVTPKELVREAVDLAARKADLSVKDMLIRGALSGAFLGFATSLVFTVNSQGLPPVVGAILFPVGFVILVRPEHVEIFNTGNARQYSGILSIEIKQMLGVAVHIQRPEFL